VSRITQLLHLCLDIQYRTQVRITSQKEYGVGTVWTMDIVHMPFGCSVSYPFHYHCIHILIDTYKVWPAIWTKGHNWPQDGEIEYELSYLPSTVSHALLLNSILEGINLLLLQRNVESLVSLIVQSTLVAQSSKPHQPASGMLSTKLGEVSTRHSLMLQGELKYNPSEIIKLIR